MIRLRFLGSCADSVSLVLSTTATQLCGTDFIQQQSLRRNTRRQLHHCLRLSGERLDSYSGVTHSSGCRTGKLRMISAVLGMGRSVFHNAMYFGSR